MTIEDVEQATILYELGLIKQDDLLEIILEYALQPENPLLVKAKKRINDETNKTEH